jgi:FAD:protein FMN transferase
VTPAIAGAMLALGTLAGAPLGAAARPCQEVTLRRARPMMATTVAVTVRGCDADVLEERVRESFAEMERLAAILSEWEPASPLSRVNSRAGVEPVRVPRELYEVLQTALQVSRLTSGAFDPTWAALDGLWRFDDATPQRLPPPEQVERRRALVGYRRLALEPAGRTAFLVRPGARIGLGGIAKGYIAEAAANFLVARGVHDVLVAASGDMTARGRNGDRPWTIAIRDPRDPSGALATVRLEDESISTSGDYERFFVVDGRRYQHIIDPRTGYPATGTASVTVIAPHGALADALATGLFVLGPERGAAVARRMREVSALLIDAEGEAHLGGSSRRFAARDR